MSTHATPKAKPFAALLGLLPATAAGAAAGEDGDAQPEGAFTCDSGLSTGLPQDKIAPSIERDPMYMAARPGLIHKHIPISFDAKKPRASPARRQPYDVVRRRSVNRFTAQQKKFFTKTLLSSERMTTRLRCPLQIRIRCWRALAQAPQPEPKSAVRSAASLMRGCRP